MFNVRRQCSDISHPPHVPSAACSKTPGHPSKNLSNFLTTVLGSCSIHSSWVSPRKSPTVPISSAASCFAAVAAQPGLIPSLVHRKHVLMPRVAARSVSARFISRSSGNRQVSAETVHGNPQGTVVTVRVGDITSPRNCWNSLQLRTLGSCWAQTGTHVTKRRRGVSCQQHADDKQTYRRRSLGSA